MEALLATGRMPADAAGRREFLGFLCRQLEATAINALFQAARRTVPQDGLFSGGFAGAMYQGLADQEYAREIASRGGFGIGDAVFRQIAGRRRYAAGSGAADGTRTMQSADPQKLKPEKSSGPDAGSPKGAPAQSDN
jgi:flagellar protein FlgJ